MKIYLLRHGEAKHNAQRVFPIDDKGSPLTEKGKQQAEQAAGTVKNLGITHVYSSDMRRALDTASIATKDLGLEIQRDDRLRELGNGKKTRMAGLPYTQIPKDFLDNQDKYGGEPFEALYERSRKFIKNLQNQIEDDNANILLVGHGGQQCMIIYCLSEDLNKPFDEKSFKEKYFKDRSNASITMMDMGEYKPGFKHLIKPTMVCGEDRGTITTVANTKE